MATVLGPCSVWVCIQALHGTGIDSQCALVPSPAQAQRESKRAAHLGTIYSGTALCDSAAGSDGGHPGERANKGAKAAAGPSLGGAGEEHRWGAPFASQVAILFRRSLRTRRFQSLSAQDFVQFLLIAVLGGLFWLQAGQKDTLVSARNTLGE